MWKGASMSEDVTALFCSMFYTSDIPNVESNLSEVVIGCLLHTDYVVLVPGLNVNMRIV